MVQITGDGFQVETRHKPPACTTSQASCVFLATHWAGRIIRGAAWCTSSVAPQRMENAQNMPVVVPEPDGERDGVPLWLCPNCNDYKPLQEYAWKKRKDIIPGKWVWFKQGYCNSCLQTLIKDHS